MCGIVGAATRRQVSGILLEGLKRLEYRGYDSAGMACIDAEGNIRQQKHLGKVAVLEQGLEQENLDGVTGIAHTRWATHGKPSTINAHPHSSSGEVSLVHNGIIENHDELRAELIGKGYEFVSETDTEVVTHLIHDRMKSGESLRQSVQAVVKRLHGAYGLAVISRAEPERVVCARSGSPLVIGIGIGEHFLASDQLALRQVTDRFVYLEEGDIAEISPTGYGIWNAEGEKVDYPVQKIRDSHETADKGNYRHYMQKEIHEQPAAIRRTLEGRIGKDKIYEQAFGASAHELFETVEQVHIIACGTSYHAGLVARLWIEEWVGVPCHVEVASEFRYRKVVVPRQCLFVCISQSGETADTLAALRVAKTMGYAASLAICNAPRSSLVRESELAFMTNAGLEIGVASTKAFTTQLVALSLLTLSLAQCKNVDPESFKPLIQALHDLPDAIEEALQLDAKIQQLAEEFADKHHALFLGRGVQFPVAMEGALKLKEISYIHAEAYPAGELKHGPLALVDADMPIVTVAPNDDLLEKLKSNLEEVRARGGRLFVFADPDTDLDAGGAFTVLNLPKVEGMLAPILFTIPLQLLAYHAAILKGTDVDQPRNLAKSVTVE